ncbi:MAG: hypothetical protein IPM54_28875 [Polyangiaceae bacterium]|nr:hypothetical protein [Polyangiaceae bacterium]
MAKNTYQSYTEKTPIYAFRADFVWRGAMCIALGTRHPALVGIGNEANAIVAQIDARLAALQAAEDDQLRARAIENAEKLDVVDVYTELRRTMSAKNYDVAKILPDAPSILKRMRADSFAARADIAVANLEALPENDPIRVAFLANLKKELAEFHEADKAEDKTQAALRSGNVALTLCKSELAQAREAQLGAILTELKDREKSSAFTLPWRKYSRAADDGEE